MPISPAFVATQSPTTPQTITLTDTSSGSDVTVVARWAYFQTSQGQYLTASGLVDTPTYIEWSIGSASQSFSILTEDLSLIVTVKWVTSGGVTVVELTQVYCFPQFNKNFFYYLLQQQALSPSIVQDTSYYQNLCTYWINIIGAIQAIEIGADVSASQNCLNRATLMMNNQTMYF